LGESHGFDHGFPLIRSLRASAQRSASVLFSFVLSFDYGWIIHHPAIKNDSSAISQPTEWQHIGNQIDLSMFQDCAAQVSPSRRDFQWQTENTETVPVLQCLMRRQANSYECKTHTVRELVRCGDLGYVRSKRWSARTRRTWQTGGAFWLGVAARGTRKTF